MVQRQSQLYVLQLLYFRQLLFLLRRVLMKEVIEEYGDFLIAIVATIGIIAIIIYACSASGILSNFVSSALGSSC